MLQLLSYTFLPPALRHLLIDVHSLRIIPLVPRSPSSFLNQTLTGGGDAFSRQSSPLHPRPPPFRACSQTEGAPTGLPVNFLLRGLIQYYMALGDGVNFSSV